MAQRRGKESGPPRGPSSRSDARRADAEIPGAGPDEFADAPGSRSAREAAAARGAVPEWFRKALSAGFSGFFFTEEAIRKALGDTLPRDWAEFASDQSSRARAEFLERLSYEIGRALENLDYAAVLAQLLEGRTLEVNASIRLREDEGRRRRPELRVDVSRKEDE